LPLSHYLLQLRRELFVSFLCRSLGTMNNNHVPGSGKPHGPHLPFQDRLARGETVKMDGTNVVRVPFGVRQARRARPERPDTWATLVLPLQRWEPTPPPQAA
jgi:hypothetical protein